jgi:hypothetical protein
VEHPVNLQLQYGFQATAVSVRDSKKGNTILFKIANAAKVNKHSSLRRRKGLRKINFSDWCMTIVVTCSQLCEQVHAVRTCIVQEI